MTNGGPQIVFRILILKGANVAYKDAWKKEEGKKHPAMFDFEKHTENLIYFFSHSST